MQTMHVLKWFVGINWNPIVKPGRMNCFSPIGFNVTWDDEDGSWMIHVFLLLVLIEFGCVSID